MGRVMPLLVLLLPAGCQAPRRPDFLMRVIEDCAAGQQWACELLGALSRPSEEDMPTPAPGARRGPCSTGPCVSNPDIPASPSCLRAFVSLWYIDRNCPGSRV